MLDAPISAKTGIENYCDLCSTVTPHEMIYSWPDIADRPTATKRCERCSYVHLDPIPDTATIRSFYENDAPYGYVSNRLDDYANVVHDKLIFIDWVLDIAGGAPSVRRFLDIGCGIGLLIHAMSLRGFDGLGTDFQAEAATVGAHVFGSKIVQASIADLRGQKYGAIALCDSIEHLPSPTDDLRAIRQLLHEDGILFGNAPNFHGIDRYLWGAKSVTVGFPQHLSCFTPKTLRALLEKNGFDVKFIGFVPPYTVSYTLGLRQKLRDFRNKLRSSGIQSLCNVLISGLTWTKRHVCYPLANFFVLRTGLLGQSTVFVARPRLGWIHGR